MSVENNKSGVPAGGLAETDWMAFAYVAGELDGVELDEWTARLAEGDIEACEAVGRAVELVQAVSVPNRPSVAIDAMAGHSISRAARWRFVVAAALCLMLVVGLSWQQGERAGDEQAADVMAGQIAVDGEVLSTWAGGTDAEPADVRTVTGPERLVAETELVVPEWMIAAVALPSEVDGENDQ